MREWPKLLLFRDAVGRRVVLTRPVTRRDGHTFQPGTAMVVDGTHQGRFSLWDPAARKSIRGVHWLYFDLVED